MGAVKEYTRKECIRMILSDDSNMENSGMDNEMYEAFLESLSIDELQVIVRGMD